MALKWSDQGKVNDAIKAIKMADNLVASAPLSITVRVNMADSDKRDPAPEVTLTPGTQAYDNTLTSVTNKLNSDKTAAQSYLTSVGVTND